MDWSVLDTLAGAAAAVGGMLIGAQPRVRRLMGFERRELEDPKPICGCKHHYSHHDENGMCHAIVQGDYLGAIQGYRQTPCTCKRYTGPEPLPRYIP